MLCRKFMREKMTKENCRSFSTRTSTFAENFFAFALFFFVFSRHRRMTFFIVVTFKNYFMMMRILLALAPFNTDQCLFDTVKVTSRKKGGISACLWYCKCFRYNLVRWKGVRRTGDNDTLTSILWSVLLCFDASRYNFESDSESEQDIDC